jgi:hypothetical protein
VRNCQCTGEQSRAAPPNEAFPQSKEAPGQNFEGAIDDSLRFTSGGPDSFRGDDKFLRLR